MDTRRGAARRLRSPEQAPSAVLAPSTQPPFRHDALRGWRSRPCWTRFPRGPGSVWVWSAPSSRGAHAQQLPAARLCPRKGPAPRRTQRERPFPPGRQALLPAVTGGTRPPWASVHPGHCRAARRGGGMRGWGRGRERGGAGRETGAGQGEGAGPEAGMGRGRGQRGWGRGRGWGQTPTGLESSKQRFSTWGSTPLRVDRPSHRCRLSPSENTYQIFA